MFRIIAAIAVAAAVFAAWTMRDTGDLANGSPERMQLADPGVEGSIVRLSRAVEGVNADPASIDFWVGRYRDGHPLQAIGEAFASTPRFARTYGKDGDAQFVDKLYKRLLDRAPTARERKRWDGKLAAGAGRATVLLALTESPEFVKRTGTAPPHRPRRLLAPPGVEHSVARLYLAFTGAWPEDRALDADVGRYLDGTPLDKIAEGLLERIDDGRLAREDPEGFVETLYRDVLGRAPDRARTAKWKDRLAKGESRGAVAVAFTESAEMQERTSTAEPLPAPIPHKLLAVGDSVMKGAVARIQAIPGWEVHVDARGCRQPTRRGDGCGDIDIPSGVDALRAARAAGHMGGAVAIQLGNNGPMSAEQFDELMREVADQRLVLALTLHEPRRYEGPNNTVITEATERWPNLRVLDWHTFATGKDYFSESERIHLGHAGAQAMADLIVSGLPNY